MRTIGAVLLTAFVLAGCSSGSDSAAPADGTKIATQTTLPSLAPEDINVNASPYCAQWAEVRRVAGDDIGSLDAAGVRRHYADLQPHVEKLAAVAPEQLRRAVAVALAATKDAARSGTNEAFGTDGASGAQRMLLTYAFDHCRKK